MLNEKEFFDAMKEELSCLLGDSYKIKMDDSQNVFVKKMTQSKVYRFHGDELFGTYLNGVGMKEICRKVKDYIVMLEPLKEVQTLSFAEAQNHIFMRVINREQHKDILQNVPYLPFLDLAIVAYYEYDWGESKKTSSFISNYMMKKWNLPKEVVFSKAWENMQRDYPMSIGDLSEMMASYMFNAPFEGSSIEELEFNLGYHVLTNKKGKFGFTSIFYPDVLKRYGEKFGDFYIIPASIHEALLLSKKAVISPEMNIKNLVSLIHNTNETQLLSVEVLSDSLYYYDAVLNRVSIVQSLSV